MVLLGKFLPAGKGKKVSPALQTRSLEKGLGVPICSFQRTRGRGDMEKEKIDKREAEPTTSRPRKKRKGKKERISAQQGTEGLHTAPIISTVKEHLGMTDLLFPFLLR